MACYSMHLAFAKIINEKIKMNDKDFLIGALAADICKKDFYIKRITHFTLHYTMSDYILHSRLENISCRYLSDMSP